MSSEEWKERRCFYPLCTVSPETGGTLSRVNAKGQPGIWACREHIKQTDAKVAPEVKQVTDLISRRKADG